MASFAGIRGTGKWATDERPKNFREMILWLNPNGSAPLTALMSKMKKENTDDPEFSWFEEKLAPVRLQINDAGNYISTSNTLTVLGAGALSSGGLACVPGDLFIHEITEVAANGYENEILMVSSVTSDTVVVFKRGVANTTNAAIADDDYLLKIGNAFAEGSLSPDISLRNPTKVTNYTQIFKTAVGLTNTAAKTHLRTGDGWTNDKKRKMFDHSVTLETAFMFGKPYEDTSGSQIKRYTGGLRSFITTNVTIFTTTPTEDTFLDAVYKVWNYTSNGAGDERIGLCGNGFLNGLNKIARNADGVRINYDKALIDVYGMKLQRWIFPQGTIGFKTHPLMNLNSRYTNSAFIIDPTTIRYRPLQGRDTKFEDNIQANDEDSRKGQWLTEAGLEMDFEACSAYIGNFVV